MNVVEIALGVAIVALVLFDVFASMILPRPVGRNFRLSAYFSRNLWHIARAATLPMPDAKQREAMLGAFAPFVLLIFLALWVVLLVFGYGLILDGMRASIHPEPHDLLTSIYYAGTTLLTIGYGDYVAQTPLPRFIALTAAASGLAVMAIGTTFLFSIFTSFQRREVFVVVIDALAGGPPSGVQFLATAKALDIVDDLPRLFADGQRWSAEVLDSHLAYAILAYFRSTHLNASWIATLGALLDAATLLLTTIEGVPSGHARLMHDVGTHLTEDLTTYFGIANARSVLVEFSEFESACDELRGLGYSVRPAADAWPTFSAMRSEYAAPLNAMAKFWAITPARWIGDRSSLDTRH